MLLTVKLQSGQKYYEILFSNCMKSVRTPGHNFFLVSFGVTTGQEDCFGLVWLWRKYMVPIPGEYSTEDDFHSFD